MRRSMKKEKYKYVLIACEESQTVCREFRRLGAVAFSCDIQKCSGGHDEWHIRENVLPFLRGRRYFTTEDRKIHHVPQWDLIIAHPPCTYISKAGSNHLVKNGQVNKIREAYGIVAVDFFQKCLDAKAKCVCVENPVPMARWGLPMATQIIGPWQFGHPYTKRTCLWLKNLPPLLPTIFAMPRKSWVRNTHLAKKRSKTFPGIAKAMAEQWFPLI